MKQKVKKIKQVKISSKYMTILAVFENAGRGRPYKRYIYYVPLRKYHQAQ